MRAKLNEQVVLGVVWRIQKVRTNANENTGVRNSLEKRSCGESETLDCGMTKISISLSNAFL